MISLAFNVISSCKSYFCVNLFRTIGSFNPSRIVKQSCTYIDWSSWIKKISVKLMRRDFNRRKYFKFLRWTKCNCAVSSCIKLNFLLLFIIPGIKIGSPILRIDFNILGLNRLLFITSIVSCVWSVFNWYFITVSNLHFKCWFCVQCKLCCVWTNGWLPEVGKNIIEAVTVFNLRPK